MTNPLTPLRLATVISMALLASSALAEPNYHEVRLVRAFERLRVANNPSLGSEIILTIKYVAGPDLTGAASDGPGGGGGGPIGGGPDGVVSMEIEDEPGGTVTDGIKWIYIQASDIVAVRTSAGRLFSWSSDEAAFIVPGDEVDIRALGTGPLGVSIWKPISWNPSIGRTEPPLGDWMCSVEDVVYTITKTALGDVAIDTRKAYGQPNRVGEVADDPNAELQNVRFGNWEYKGGLFVGNAPASTKDRSGLARIQLTSEFTGANELRMCFASLFHLGSPTDSRFRTSVEVGAWTIPTSDPNYGTPESTTDWSTRWNVDTTQAPIRTATLSSSNENQFVCFQLTRVVDTGTSPNYTTNFITDLQAAKRLCIGVRGDLTYTGTTWHYFASREFLPDPPAGANGLEPRLWTVSWSSATTRVGGPHRLPQPNHSFPPNQP